MTEQELIDRLDACLAMYTTDPAGMLETGRELVREAERLGVVWLRTTALMACGAAAYYLGRHEDLLGYYREAEALHHLVERPIERGKLLNELARVRISHGRYSEALDFLIEARIVLEQENETRFLSQTLDLIGILLRELGEYEQALPYLLQGLDLRTEHDIAWGRVNSLCNIGGLYSSLKEYRKAEEYFETSLRECREMESDEGVSYSLGLIGNNCLTMGRDAEALEYLAESLEKRVPGDATVCYTLNGIGVGHEHLGQFDTALEYYSQALDVAKNADIVIMRAFIPCNIASIYKKQGRPEEALDLLLEGVKVAEEMGLQVEQSELHERLSDIYAAMGRLTEAVAHYTTYSALREKIVDAQRTRAVIATEIRHAVENAERQRELLRLRAEQVEREMEYKVKELNGLILQLTRRNEMLKMLYEIAFPYRREGRGQTRELATRIIEDIESASSLGEGWALFEEVYREFIGKLRGLGPKLTPTEVRICVLIKMNLSTKQIADLLFTSVAAVKMHRVHARRKLGLGTDENLGSLLLSL